MNSHSAGRVSEPGTTAITTLYAPSICAARFSITPKAIQALHTPHNAESDATYCGVPTYRNRMNLMPPPRDSDRESPFRTAAAENPTGAPAPAQTAQNIHRRAMNLAAQGFMAQMSSTPDSAVPLFAQALELELAAIRQLKAPVEPTWSVLHRSAGWMAVHCGQHDTAARLATTALAGNPPADIADELRTLLAAANAGHDAKQST